VCHLVIGDSEGDAGTCFQQLAAELLAHGDQAVFAEYPVEVDRPGDRIDPVLGENHHVDAALLVERDQLAGYLVDLAQLQRYGLAGDRPAAGSNPGAAGRRD
jgi:hypothetical protein